MLAWALWALWLALASTGVWLLAIGRIDGPFDALAPSFMAGFATVGALIAARLPANAIGWILLAVPILLSATALGEGVAAGAADPSLPLPVLAAWFGQWAWYVWLGLCAIFLPLLFPDGRLPSPRWRPLAWLGGAAITTGALIGALAPGPLEREPGAPDNPFAAGDAAGEAFALVGVLGRPIWAVLALAAGGALVLRLRRAHGREHQQLKWFAYAAGLTLVCFVLAAIGEALGGQDESPPVVAEAIGSFGYFSGLALVIFGIPLSVGIAILRHRLYDIDVVINRTLVYGALTVTLALSYLGAVLALGQLFAPLTRGSDLAIAASTLAVAALVRPLRARIQLVVDRRFYRHKYDAARTLEGFSARLREQVDLDALGGELEAVVRETMAPAHVSLWLRTRRMR